MIKVPVNELKESYVQSVCIEFECLFDVPFGIMRTIREKFYDPGVFHKYWIECDNYNLRVLLYDRAQYNPLIESSISGDVDEANELYNEIFNNTEVYGMVLCNSPKIAMFNMARTLATVDIKADNRMVDYTIICKNKLQSDYVKKFIPDIKTSICMNYNFDIRQYDLIVLERYENILKYADKFTIENHNIWIPEFAYNMDREDRSKPDFAVSAFVSDINKICVYEPYNNFIKPVG